MVAVTNAVVAICVVLVPAVAVGAVGTPVNATSTIVLFVKVSVPAKVAIVPLVGKVIVLPEADEFKVMVPLPVVTNGPPNVIVLV